MAAGPVDELESLEGKRDGVEDLALKKEPTVLVEGLSAARIRVVFEPPMTGPVAFRVRGLDVVYDRTKSTLSCGKVVAPLKPDKGGLVSFDLLVDNGSVEIFKDDGLLAISVAHVGPPNEPTLAVSGEGCTRNAISWRPLKSAWK
jgi:fructan beta-fructosidase